ncbi:TPA: hypothetical protein ACOEOW_003862 [Enterobacter hormaechei subsp. xiangfangensis]
MKITDDFMMRAIFRQTLQRIPHRAIQRFVGGRVSMADDAQFTSAVRLLAANRKSLGCGLADSQSLVRLRALVDMHYLSSDEKRQLAEPGRTFWYWLPESLTRPVWLRAREILGHCGLDYQREPVLMPSADVLADSVAAHLAEEFDIYRHETGRSTSWILRSNRA